MSVLDRIDHALAVQDAMPALDGDWQPGDPLWEFPSGVLGTQCVRPMFEVLDDPHPVVRCEPCGVGWDGPEPCWVCGVERNSPWAFDHDDFRAFRARFVTALRTPDRFTIRRP